MRKTKLFWGILLTAAMLAACGKKPTTHVGDNGLTYANDMNDALALVKPNAKGAEKVTPGWKVLNRDASKFNSPSLSLAGEESMLLDTDYAEYGVVVVKNEAGFAGLYSSFFNDWIVKPAYVPGTFSYSAFVTDQAYYESLGIPAATAAQYATQLNAYGCGAFIIFTYNGVSTLYDSLGHVLATSDAAPLFFVTGVGNALGAQIEELLGYYTADIAYAVSDLDVPASAYNPATGEVFDYHIFESTAFEGEAHYLYDDTGAVGLIEDSFINMISDESGYLYDLTSTKAKYTFAGAEKLDLEDYGLDGYKILQTGTNLFGVFKETKDGKGTELVCTFVLDDTVFHPVGVIGQKMIAQASRVLPADSEDYDYLTVAGTTNYRESAVTKYDVQTIAIDLFEGTREELDYKVLFTDYIRPLAGTNGKFGEYFSLSFTDFSTGMLALESSEVVINKDFVVVQDMTSRNNRFFLDMGDGYYYSTQSKALYKGDKMVTSFYGEGNDIVPLPEHKAFMSHYNPEGSSNHYYGLVKNNGVIVEGANYKQFASDNEDTVLFHAGVNGNFFATENAANAETFVIHADGSKAEKVLSSEGTITQKVGSLFELVEEDDTFLKDDRYYKFYGTAAEPHLVNVPYRYANNEEHKSASPLLSLSMFGHNVAYLVLEDSTPDAWKLDLYSLVEKDFAFKFNSNGEARTEGFQAGTLEDPFKLAVGENAVPTKTAALTYVSYAPAADGKFEVVYDEDLYMSFPYVWDRHVQLDGEGHEVVDPVTGEKVYETVGPTPAEAADIVVYDEVLAGLSGVVSAAGYEMEAGHEYIFAIVNMGAEANLIVREHKDIEDAEGAVAFFNKENGPVFVGGTAQTLTALKDGGYRVEEAAVSDEALTIEEFKTELAAATADTTIVGGVSFTADQLEYEYHNAVAKLTAAELNSQHKYTATMIDELAEDVEDPALDILITKFYFTADAGKAAIGYTIEAETAEGVMVSYALYADGIIAQSAVATAEGTSMTYNMVFYSEAHLEVALAEAEEMVPYPMGM